MAFDKSLDKNLFSETVQFETTKITVGVFSYNDGTPKMQISRENLNQNSGEYTFSKLGRMLKEEAEAFRPKHSTRGYFLLQSQQKISSSSTVHEMCLCPHGHCLGESGGFSGLPLGISDISLLMGGFFLIFSTFSCCLV